MASLVLGFHGLPYKMPLRCLIGTASWCLCDAGDRRVAQRYIDFAFGLGRRENWDRIEFGDRASAFQSPLAWGVGIWPIRCSDIPAASCSRRQGAQSQVDGCDSKARSWSWSRSWSSWRLELGRTWAGKPYQCLFGGPAACLLYPSPRGCKSALRNPGANPGRRLFVA